MEPNDEDRGARPKIVVTVHKTPLTSAKTGGKAKNVAKGSVDRLSLASINKMRVPGVPYLPPPPDPNMFKRDQYKNHPLLTYRRQKEKQKEIQEIIKRQAIKNRAKALKKKAEQPVQSVEEEDPEPVFPQEHYIAQLRKCAERSPIAPIEKSTLNNITKNLPLKLRENYSNCVTQLLQEAAEEYEASLRVGTVNMLVRNPEEEKKEKEKIRKPFKDSKASWYDDFIKNRKIITIHLHILHPAIRNILGICKDHLNYITMADCKHFRGDAIDLETFSGNIISECEKTEETLMTSWYPAVTAVFNDKTITKGLKGERLKSFYSCVSALLSIQLRDLLMRSITSYVQAFQDHRTLPRVEMELVLSGKKIEFSPSCAEVADMIISVVHEMNKLLREVPTIQSWLTGSSNQFVPVTLNKDFIKKALADMKIAIEDWLKEPQTYCQSILDRFDFLIDGRAKREIEVFIKKKPKFEEICKELEVYNKYVEKTQEISSLEYFTFVRLDCEKLRKGLGDVSRKLSNTLLKNVVDTYRGENQSICKAFEDIESKALSPPESTGEMIALGEFMLNVKNKVMNTLKEEIECSKGHLLYLIDVHIFSKEDINLNTTTLAWPQKIKPVFEQNTEIVEDCKAKFEESLQGKSENITKELEKLNLRVKELEDLGEMKNIQQYTYEVRLLQNKLKSLENTICWVNEEEALFKFPQTAYQDVGDINTIQSGEGKMKAEIEPYARLFTTVLKWQKAEKKWMDGAFLDLNSLQIKADIDEFSNEMVQLQKLFKSKFKQAALDGESKYSKMNLEDSDPNQLPPPLKICALTIAAIDKFTENIRVISCLCNPGIRIRHWNRMSAIIGYDITPNSGSSLRKVLRLSLEAFMDRLEEVSVSATKEHALELSLNEMIKQWNDIAFETTNYRDSTIKILGPVEIIESYLDDHLVKTQTMRGSPYFKPFEKEVLGWENQLIRIQNTITTWINVQEKWLYLEPILTVEDIVRHMPTESILFREVDAHWKTVMDNISQNPKVLKTAGVEGMLEMLEKSVVLLKDINIGLQKYLEQRKLVFPRFFFLSNKEILQILSETKDPTKVQPFLRNIFEGIDHVEFNDIQAIQAIISPLGERIQLSYPIQPREAKGCVEKWLYDLQNQVHGSMQDLMATSRESYNTFKRAEWVMEWPCQIVLTVCLLIWTAEIQEAIKGGEQALQEQCNRQQSDLQDLLSLLEGESTPLVKATIRSVIVQDIHMRDVTDEVHKRKIASENDFFWLRQLKMLSVDDTLTMNMLDISTSYRYEYLGHIDRLVMTPLTQKSFLALLTAFKICYFGSIEGFTSTGKTSLIKELACYLGVMHKLKNGSTNVTMDSLTSFFKGVASSGCWATIEDFDRASPETMSIASVLLESLRNCAKGKLDSIQFLGHEKFAVEKGYFVTTTQNTSYIGRNPIPDSFRLLFRPITMIKPDKKTIVEAKLISYGFSDSNNLTKNLINVITVIESQLPKEDHYNFGLRTIIKILDVALQKKSKENESDETMIVLSSIQDVLTKTLNDKDIAEMKAILSQFYDTEKKQVPMEGDSKLQENPGNFVVTEQMQKKITEVRNALNLYTGVIITGVTYTGKTTILKFAANLKEGTEISVINPKSLETGQLFGHSDSSDTAWRDGLVSKLFKTFSSSANDNDKLITFDGPVDMVWIENFNTVLDENSILCLESGESISMTPSMKIVFESCDLERVSPATISRCGIVYVNDSCLTWKQIFSAWFNKIKKQAWLENHDVLLQQLFEWLLPPLLETTESCKMAADIATKNIVQCSLELFEILLLEALPNLKERKYLRGWIQAAVVYSCVWSLGGCLATDEERAKFDTGIREVIFGKRSAEFPLPKSLNGKFDSLPPVEGMIFEFVFDFKARGQWKHWNDIIKNTEIEDMYNYQSVLVPTIDSARYMHILDLAIKRNKPFMIIGPKGTGKTSYMKNKINQGLNFENEEAFTLNLTPKIKQSTIFNSIVSNLNKQRRGLYGPVDGKKCVMFIDNFGLPLPDEHGDQPATEIIHQLLDHKFMYDHRDFSKVELQNTSMITCMTTSYGMNQKLSDRTLRHFHAISTTPPSDESINKIFSARFNVFFKTRGFQPEAAGVIGPIIQSAILIYNTMKETLLPTPKKSHYIFDMTDISKLVDGCTLLPKELSDNKKLYTRIWVHECLRVFNDRLTCPEDTGILFEKIKHCVKTIFRENFDSAFEHLGKVDGFVTEFNLRNLTFGDFIEVEERKFYQEIISFDDFSKQGTQIVDNYVKANPQFQSELMFFKYSMENICKICRVLSQPGGNILLLGEGGTGRETAARVAAMLKVATFYKPPISDRFTFKDWRIEIKKLLKEAGGSGTCCVLFLTVETLSNPDFLSDINTLLTNGEIDGIFSVDEKHEITEQVHQYLKANKLETEKELTPTELYNKFLERCMDNFHLVIKLPSNTNHVRDLCRTYPEFLNKSVVCYFNQWPDDALQKAAEMVFEDLSVSREQRKIIVNASKEFYAFAKKKTKETNKEYQHRIEISPSSYIAFIKFFSQLYQSKFSEVTQKKKSYESIIKKYETIQSEIEELENDLEEIKNQIDQLDDEYGTIQKKIDEETIQHKELNEALEEEGKLVNIEQEKLNVIQEDVDKEFRVILQQIEDCATALKAFDTTDIQQPLSVKKPSAALKKAIASVALLLGVEPAMIPDPSSKKKDAELVPDYWGPGKKLLLEPNLLQRIIDFDKYAISEEIVEALKRDFTSAPEFDPTMVAKHSASGEAMCKWSKSIDDFIRIDEANQDKKDFLKAAQEAFEEFKLTYKAKKKAVTDQEDLLNGLRQQQTENKEKEKELKDEANFGKIKMNRGIDIVQTFAKEKEWWIEENEKQDFYLQCMLGDILLVSAMVLYLPSLPNKARDESMETFGKILKEKEVQFSNKDSRVSLFLSEILMKKWEQFGLPSNYFYIFNGLLITICPRWPLLVDPEQQAVNWIKNLEEELLLVDANDKDIVRKVRNSVELGIPTMISNVEEKIDSHLDNLIKKTFFVEGNIPCVVIGGETVKYNKKFKLYFTSRKGCIDFPSRFQSHLTIINFVLVSAGLQDHLLRIVVSKERPDLKQKKEAAMRQYCEATKLLEENRTKVLNILLQTEGNILENQSAVENLKECQNNISEHLLKIQKVKGHQEKIEEINVGYSPIAKHASVLFETIHKLSSLNHMYRYSLLWFSNLYSYSIENSNKSKMLQKRLRYLSDHLTFNCFLQISRSLYHKDKRTFSFMLCIDLMIYKQKLKPEDFQILMEEVKGDAEKPNPAPEWLADDIWSKICSLEKIDDFSGIIEDFSIHTVNWKMIHEAKEPDDLPLHEPWHSRLSKFFRLIVIKILRPDKMTELLDTFISENLGYKFVEPLSFDLGRILADTGPRTPMIFLLDSSKNPMPMVKKLRQDLNVICLSKQLEETIMKTLETALKEGNWVYIQNCHIAPECSSTLEKICTHLNTIQDINPGFRLWLTTLPNKAMSHSVLGDSIKLAIEAPYLIKDQILDFFSNSRISDQDYYNSFPTKAASFTKLIYSIVFLIAHCNGRKSYSTDGWSGDCSFTDTDLEVALGHLAIIMKNHDGINFKALYFLLNDCNIIQRITDVQDRKLFKIILNHVCHPSLLTVNRYKFSASQDFFVPNKIFHSDYLAFIKELPIVQNYEVFNVTENSEIIRQEKEAENLVKAFKKATNYDMEISAVNSIEECKCILEQLPEELSQLDSLEAHSQFIIKEQIEEYNRLGSKIRHQIQKLLDQLEGKKILDPLSEICLKSIECKQVPHSWRKAQDFSTHNIDEYIRKFIEYTTYFKQSNNLQKMSYWLPAIRNPGKLLKSLMFEFSLIKGCSPDCVSIEVSIHEEVLDTQDSEDSHIITMTGLTLNSAKYDFENNSLTAAEHKVNKQVLPCIQLRLFPRIVEHDGAEIYECPVYETECRTYIDGTSSFCFFLPLPTPAYTPEELAKSGAAITTQF